MFADFDVVTAILSKKIAVKFKFGITILTKKATLYKPIIECRFRLNSAM